MRRFLFETTHDAALMIDREGADRDASPSAGQRQPAGQCSGGASAGVKHLFADGADDRRKLVDKAAFKKFVVEILRRIGADPGFRVLPRRWVVEGTFGWMTRWRRLVRDYESASTSQKP
jgi:transposase